jgi:hypothetical protein
VAPPRWQPSLDDFIDLASFLLGADRAAVERLPRLPLAESAMPPTTKWSRGSANAQREMRDEPPAVS